MDVEGEAVSCFSLMLGFGCLGGRPLRRGGWWGPTVAGFSSVLTTATRFSEPATAVRRRLR